MYTALNTPRIGDAELCLLIRLRCSKGPAVLYDSYAKFLFSAIRRIVPQREDAEEILLATFEKIWVSIDEYVTEKEKLYTWMVRIAKKLAFEALSAKEIHEKKVSAL